MKSALPRVIFGNRGDLASRWGILNALAKIPGMESVVFYDQRDDVPNSARERIPYGRLRNLWPTQEGRRALRKADIVIWAAGLDLQDDSSLSKLIYLWIIFVSYRMRGLKIQCMCQGAGPLESRAGRFLAKRVLDQIDVFVARDPDSGALLRSIAPGLEIKRGHDGIFFGGFEEDLGSVVDRDNESFSGESASGSRGVVGFNIRQWYHFRRSILPYQFAQSRYQSRSEDKMQRLMQSSAECIRQLRSAGFEIALLSAYQPGSVPWEDDLPWLRKIWQGLENTSGVHLITRPLTLPAYFKLMSELDLMIGMRLHSSLIALRFGVPAINLSYTLKGESIYRALGLEDWVVPLEAFVENSTIVSRKVAAMMDNVEHVRRRTRNATTHAIQVNEQIFNELFA